MLLSNLVSDSGRFFSSSLWIGLSKNDDEEGGDEEEKMMGFQNGKACDSEFRASVIVVDHDVDDDEDVGDEEEDDDKDDGVPKRDRL